MAIYKGNVGVMEVFAFLKKATPEQKEKFNSLIKQQKNSEAMRYMESILGVKLVR